MKRVGLVLDRDRAEAVGVGGDRRDSTSAAGTDPISAVEDALSSLPVHWRRGEVAVIADVAGALGADPPPPLVVIRIAPRPPHDAVHDRVVDAPTGALVRHVPGGYGTGGAELMPLGEDALRRAAADIPDGAAVVITGVGALVDPSHEVRAAALLRDAASPGWIVGSRGYFVNDIAAREQHAVSGALLLPEAERLVERLTRSIRDLIPDARPLVAVDGGCVPLSRLAIDPGAAVSAGGAERAAQLPMTFVRERMVRAHDGADVDRALAEDRALVTARLMSWGAAESRVRVVESQLIGGTYGDSQLVHLRVRALANLAEGVAA